MMLNLESTVERHGSAENFKQPWEEVGMSHTLPKTVKPLMSLAY